MFSIYKKIDKSLNNLYGVESISDISEIDKPFLLSMSAQDGLDKSVFGIMKLGVEAARVYTTSDVGAGFKIEDFPVDFLGIKYELDQFSRSKYQELADLLYSFLICKGREILRVKKQASRINIMTYCDATLVYKNMEKVLEEKLRSDGYSEEEITTILSEICVIAIGTNIDLSSTKASTSTIIDVNDLEISNKILESYRKILHEKNIKSLHGTLGDTNHILYVYDGRGNHSLKEYFQDDAIVKPALLSVVKAYLEHSIKNEDSKDIVSISRDDILRCLDIYSDDKKIIKELLDDLDQSLIYNSPRYTEEELKIRKELDLTCKELLAVKRKLKQQEAANMAKENAIKSLVNSVEEFSSEITYYQILTKSKMWQPLEEKDVFSKNSDREIRGLYESQNINDGKSGPML